MMWYIFYKPLMHIVRFSVISIITWGLAMSALFRCRKIIIGCNSILSITSVFGILCLTLFRHLKETVTVSLIPFVTFVNATVEPELYRSMLMNVFLFLPLGMSLPFVLYHMTRHSVLTTVTVAAIASACIEIFQFIFHIGCCEVDDIIMNTIGAAIGTISCLIYKFLYKYVEKVFSCFNQRIKEHR